MTKRTRQKRNVSYQPPSLLDAPEPPAGYKHRWVRTSVMGEDDTRNYAKKRRIGYEPVRAEEYPDWHAPTIDGGRLDGVIGHSGLVLCRIKEEIVEGRQAYYEGRAQRQDEATTNDFMAVENPVMPLSVQKRSTVTTGSRPLDEED